MGNKVGFLEKHYQIQYIYRISSQFELSFIKGLLLVEAFSLLTGFKKFLCRLGFIKIRMET